MEGNEGDRAAPEQDPYRETSPLPKSKSKNTMELWNDFSKPSIITRPEKLP